MPFTIGGDWVPEKGPPVQKKGAVKVRFVKRGKAQLTIIFNLTMEATELKDLARELKRTLGSGGGISEGNIEIQGNKVKEVEQILRSKKIMK